MFRARPGVPLFFLIGLGVACGIWLLQWRQSEAPQAITEWSAWQESLLQPVAEERLTLGQLAAVAGAGQLWVRALPGHSALLYRGTLGADWVLEGRIDATPEEISGWVSEAGVVDEAGLQSLPAGRLGELAERQVTLINLKPDSSVADKDLEATLGMPRLRLEMSDGVAWLYPQQGITAHFAEQQLVLLQVVPAGRFRQR